MSAINVVLFSSAVVVAVVLWIVLKDVPRVVRSLRVGRRVKGQIIRDHTLPFRYSLLHFPVVMFRDETGAPHEVKTRYQKKTSVREQMGEVEVAFLPEDPARTAVLVGLRFYLPTIGDALFFLVLASAVPVMALWAQK
jgi:hypothetical protein